MLDTPSDAASVFGHRWLRDNLIALTMLINWLGKDIIDATVQPAGRLISGIYKFEVWVTAKSGGRYIAGVANDISLRDGQFEVPGVPTLIAITSLIALHHLATGRRL